jgi:hypothetical protein
MRVSWTPTMASAPPTNDSGGGTSESSAHAIRVASSATTSPIASGRAVSGRSPCSTNRSASEWAMVVPL